MEHTPAALSRRGYVLFVDSAISAALGSPAAFLWSWLLLGHMPSFPSEEDLLGC